MSKKKINNPVLKTWLGLNEVLRKCSFHLAQSLLDEELAGRRRKQFLLRIHSRINKLRATTERGRLKRKSK